MRQQQLSTGPRRQSDGGPRGASSDRSARTRIGGGFGILRRSSRAHRNIRPALTFLTVIATALVVVDAHLLAALLAPSWWAPALVAGSWWFACEVAKELVR